MLQPRRRTDLLLALFLLAGVLLQGSCDAEESRTGDLHSPQHVHRERRDADVTTVLLAPNTGGTLGVLTHTARTFVQDGATTEFATRVLGTTVEDGRLYAQLLETTSRVFYDAGRLSPPRVPDYAARPTPNIRAHVVYPSKPFTLLPKSKYHNHDEKVVNVFAVPETTTDRRLTTPTDTSETQRYDETPDETPDALDELLKQSNDVKKFGNNFVELQNTHEDESESSENLLKTKRMDDFFNKRNIEEHQSVVDVDKNELKPAKVVRLLDDLPTFTVRHDFAPSGFSVDEVEESTEKRKDSSPKGSRNRGGKALFRGGIANNLRKLDTVTYFGFADFTTTVGDTVIVFMPNTKSAPESRPVTTIAGTATLGNQPMSIVTTVKTFMSHTPGMVTRTVTGHSLSMQTAIPTMVVLPETPTTTSRHHKALDDSSIYVVDAVAPQAETTTKQEETESLVNTPKENEIEVVTDSQMSFEQTSSFLAQEQESFQSISPEVIVTSEYEIEPSSVMLDISSSIQSSEITSNFVSPSIEPETSTPILESFTPQPTEPLWTFATTRTQTIPHGDNPYPEGLIKAIAGTRALDGTTTLFTSLIYGTFSAGEYAQVVHSTSSVFFFVDETKVPTSDNIQPTAVLNAPSITTSVDVTTEPTTEGVPETTTDIVTTPQMTTEEEGLKTTEDDGSLSTLPIEATTLEIDSELTNEVETGGKNNVEIKDNIVVPDKDTTQAEELTKNDVFSTESLSQVSTKIGFVTQLIPTKVFKTFTYLTTFFIPVGPSSTTNSIRSREVVSEEISFVTKLIQPSVEVSTPLTLGQTPSVTFTKEDLQTTTPDGTMVGLAGKDLDVNTMETPRLPTRETTRMEQSTTEGATVIKSLPIPTTTPRETDQDITTENEEDEIDLIFKTVYTTFTYLTTFFHETTTSVSSREEVVTNVVTSTLDRNFILQASDPAVAGLFDRDDSLLVSPQPGVQPTSVGVGRPTTNYFPRLGDNLDQDLFSSVVDNVDVEKELALATPTLDASENEGGVSMRTFYKTYTYFTTILVDGETSVTTRTEVYSNSITPTNLLITPTTTSVKPTRTVTLDKPELLDQVESPQSHVPNIVQPSQEYTPLRSLALKSTPRYTYNSTISRKRPSTSAESTKQISINTPIVTSSYFEDDEDNNIFSGNTLKLEKEYAYSTISRANSDGHKDVTPNQIATSKSPIISRGVDESLSSTVSEEPIVSMVTDVTSSSSGGSLMLMLDDKTSPLDDQISSESNTEEIQPSATLLLQTYFTTYTYFTTLYKGSSSSDVISRLDTVTNIVTETLTPQSTAAPAEAGDPSLPVTYFTTYTYWTTLYKDGTSTVTTREETVSNIVTPTVTSGDTTVSAIEATPTTILTEILPTVSTSELGLVPTETIQTTPSQTGMEVALIPENLTKSAGTGYEPDTYFTTYTYFTTSYIGDSTVVNSRLEITSSVVNKTVGESDIQTGRNVAGATPIQQLVADGDVKTSTVGEQVETSTTLLPTGLLSTIVTSQVNNGTSTLFSTDVFGTYIDGFYAKILESTTSVVKPTLAPSPVHEISLQPTGVVSLNEGRIIDADGVSTTFFTTKAVGTYIDQLYAQVIESSSSIKVDPEKQTLVALSSSEGVKPFKTGLVRLIEGSIVKDHTTTFYESKVVGTIIEGRYAQIIESTSSFKLDMTSTPILVSEISTTSTKGLEQAIQATGSIETPPSSVVIESSINDGDKIKEESEKKDEDEEDNDEGDEDEDDENKSSGSGRKKSRLTFSTRKNSFSPVIRPFVGISRNRPAFNPRKKTAIASSATTITRTTLTPTITASPAAKTSDRNLGGSSRGRFSNNRRQSSAQYNSGVNEIQPTASSSRRFSRIRGSSSPGGSFSSSSSYPGGGRGRSSSGRIYATSSLGPAGSSRRGGIQRSSTGRNIASSSSYPGSSNRFRIRPTLSSGLGRVALATSVPSTTPFSDDTVGPDNDITTSVTEETDHYTDDEQETPTQPISTTTESFRRSTNPLLRLRRPPTLRTQQSSSTTPKPQTTSPRRNPLLRRPGSDSGSRTTATTTTVAPRTTRPRPNSNFNNRFKQVSYNRQRPANSLFPPRGLVRKPGQEEENAEEENAEEHEEEEENTQDGGDEVGEEFEEDIGDNDYEGSEKTESKTTSTNSNRRSGKSYTPVKIRSFVGFNRRPRVKRQTDYGSRREGGTSRTYSNRFKRPGTKPANAQERSDKIEEPEPVSEAPKSKPSGSRFTPRLRSQAQPVQRIRPSSASSNTGRSQFTLRDKDTSTSTRSNFKRPATSSTARRRPTRPETTTSAQRPKPPRLRTQQNTQQTDTTYSRANTRSRNTNPARSRSSSRTRYRSGETTDFDTYTYSQTSFDGTITITHRIPTEVTIPVVNGKVTEYRNVITASPSTEVLGPHQYTATTGKDGNPIYLLTSEMTGTLPNGATEITQFILHDTLTTSVIFTPTVIRGRKTSFSHVVPSTVYNVEQLVSTIQPQIAANAPLANILLSQLLLGNLGAQPNINSLLALNNNNNNNNGPPPTPTTEYKTRTTTYVTTVTKGTSTVIPLTFRGKEILTTIVDSSSEVITATEFITDTIVVTPTAALGAGNNQLNSLLLPALLQAQLLGQSQAQTTANPFLGLQQQFLNPEPQKLVQNDEPLLVDDDQRRPSNPRARHRPSEETERLARESEKDLLDEDYFQNPAEIVEARPRTLKSSRKKGVSRNSNGDKKPPDPPPAPVETSVITLYVSGRRPGEFSTVLSTVTVGEESSIRKREVPQQFFLEITTTISADSGNEDMSIMEIKTKPQVVEVKTSQIPYLGGSFPSLEDEFTDNLIMSAMEEVSSENNGIETESLESFVGDVSRYVSQSESRINGEHPSATNTKYQYADINDSGTTVANSQNSKKPTGHFLSNGPAELAPLKRKVTTTPNWGIEKQFENDQCITSNNSDLFVNLCKRLNNSEISLDKKDVLVHRQIRDVSEQSLNESVSTPSGVLHRRRVRIRVPINRKRMESDKELLTLSEAQMSETAPEMNLDDDKDENKEHTNTNTSELGAHRVKVIRGKRPNATHSGVDTGEHHKKRILVARRRKPVHPTPANDQLDTDDTDTSIVQLHTPVNSQTLGVTKEDGEEVHELSSAETNVSELIKSSSRRRVYITKKRPSSSISGTGVNHKHRILVTKRRLINHTTQSEEISPTEAITTESLSTIYSLKYTPMHSYDTEDSTDENTMSVLKDFMKADISSEIFVNHSVEDETDFAPPNEKVSVEGESIYPTKTTLKIENNKSKVEAPNHYNQLVKDSAIIYGSVDKVKMTEVSVKPTTIESSFSLSSEDVEQDTSTVKVSTQELPRSKISKIPQVQDLTTKVEDILLTETTSAPFTDNVKDESDGKDGGNDSIKITAKTLDSDETVVQGEDKHSQENKESEDDETHGILNANESLTDIISDAESTSTYDGPRFIRPTRFSITRKPERTKVSFAGQRRRSSASTTSSTLTSSSSFKPSYRGRKSSSRSFQRGSKSQQFHRSSTFPPKIHPTSTINFHRTNTYRENNQSHEDSESGETTTETTLYEVTEHDVNDTSVMSDETTTNTPDIQITTEVDDETPLDTPTGGSPATPHLSVDGLFSSTPVLGVESPVTPTPVLKVVTSTRLRTYTFIVTRVDGDDIVVTTTTEVKPHVTTATVTELVTPSAISGRGLNLMNPNEGRLHLATKIMSNGVEVIVADDKSTLPGAPEVLRILTTSLARPITLAPSTLTDHMMMLLPQTDSQISSSLPSREFATRTYLTTFTYFTTFLEEGTTAVSSREQVVSNLVTEVESSPPSTTPPPTSFTLSASPSLSTGVLHTTYTYLNTLMDGEIPLVVTSRHTVANTITAPQNHFTQAPQPSMDTNTYLSTLAFTKTLTEGQDVKVTSMQDVLTQVVITEFAPTHLLETSHGVRPVQGSFMDVVKTHFATYTYFNTHLEDGSTVVRSNVEISSEVVTEKFFVAPKRTTLPSVNSQSEEVKSTTVSDRPLHVYATKTYLTTFTYFTTLLQEGGDGQTSTVVSSRTRVDQNIVTDALDTSLFSSDYIDSLRNSFKEESTNNIVTMATLPDGQEIMITVLEGDKQEIHPTSTVESVASTTMPQLDLASSMEEHSSSDPSVISGSTIIFFDEGDQIDGATQTLEEADNTKPTPALSDSTVQTTILQQEGDAPIEPLPLTTFSTQVPNTDNSPTQPVNDDPTTSPIYITTTLDTSIVTSNGATMMPGDQVIMLTEADGNVTLIPVSDPANKKPNPELGGGPGGSEIQVSDLLSLGSLGINGFNALGPVINAMAGLIQGNLQSDGKRRNDSTDPLLSTNRPRPVLAQDTLPHPVYIPERVTSSDGVVRAPIYIPVGGLAEDFNRNKDDVDTAESQHFEDHLNLNGGKLENIKYVSLDTDYSDTQQRHRPFDVVIGRPTMESPILSDGIPISPGQVITANSDVIIGKHAVMGPRPPKISDVKDNFPIDMKPPPPPVWPLRDNSAQLGPVSNPNKEHSIPNVLTPFRPLNGGEILLRPPPIRAVDQEKNKPLRFENHNRNPQIINQNYFDFSSNKAPATSQSVFLSKPVKHHQNNEIIHGNHYSQGTQIDPVPIGFVPVDRSSNKPLLVSIQPSQAYNVVVSHGSSSLNSYEGAGDTGDEYFDNSPFPLPEHDAGFIGMDDVGQHSVGTVLSDNERPHSVGADSNLATGAIDVDIAPGQGINVGVDPGMNLKVSPGHFPHRRPGAQDISPSGIVSDVPPQSRPHMNEVNFDRRPQKPTLVHNPHSHRNPNRPQQHKPYLENFHQTFNTQQNVPSPANQQQNFRPSVSQQQNFPPSVNQQQNFLSSLNQQQNFPPSNKPHTKFPSNLLSGIHKYPQKPTYFMTPPPLPTQFGPDGNKPIIIPLNEERIQLPEDQNEREEDTGDEDDLIDTEGGEVIQESVRRPLRPGQIPIEVQVANSVSTHRPILLTENVGIKPTQKIDDTIQGNRPPLSFVDRPPRPDFNQPLILGFENGHDLPKPFERPDDTNFRPQNINSQNGFLGRPQHNEVHIHHEVNTPVLGSSPLIPNMNKPQVSSKPQFNVDTNPNFPYLNENIPTSDQSQPSFGMRPPPIPSDHKPQTSKFDTLTDEEYEDVEPIQPHLTADNDRHDLPTPFQPQPPLFDLEIQASTPKPHNVRFPGQFSEPNVATHRPTPGFDRQPVVDNVQDSDSSSQGTTNRPVVSIGGQRRPSNPSQTKPPYQFEVPTPQTTETSTSKKPSWGRPALHEIPSPSSNEFNKPQADKPHKQQVHKESGDSRKPPALQGSDDTEKVSTTTRRPPQIYKPKPVSPSVTSAILSSSHVTPSSIGPPPPVGSESPLVVTSVYIKNTLRPTKSSIIEATDSPMLQTVAVESPVPQESISPTSVIKPSTGTSPQWPTEEVIIGSETVFLEDVHHGTPSVTISSKQETSKHRGTTLISSGVKTIFGPLFTRPTRPSSVSPSTTTSDHKPLHENKIGNSYEDDSDTRKPDLSVASSNDEGVVLGAAERRPPPVLPTRYITHTQTLTVTTTQTTVVSSLGQPPSTRTVVLTKTQTSTIVDTVTETRTLVKPTSVTATVTTTVSTTLSRYPAPPDREPTREVDADESTGEKDHLVDENETFFVVVGDKKPGTVDVDPAVEEGDRINHAVFLGGVLVPAPVTPHEEESTSATSCPPDCSAARNELCQKVEGRMRCMCRPGFARMFLDRPCKPTYTYNMRIPLDRLGKEKLQYQESLEDVSSPHHRQMSEVTREALDRLVMQSDLRDIYHGVEVSRFTPSTKPDGVMVNFYVQLSDNTDEVRLKDVFKKSLRTSNFSLGGTEVYADRELIQYLEAEDFDECASPKFHDCSENAQCFDLRGTYTCSCKEGYTDLSENNLFPGRVCSAEQIGCEKCHYHGTCYSRGDDQLMCECFQWYAGENCHINLKVMLIALVTIGALLLALLLVCIVLTCLKRCRHKKPQMGGPRFLKYRGGQSGGAQTMDKKAMIQDSSSEGSVDNAPISYMAPPVPPPMTTFVAAAPRRPSALKKVVTTDTLQSYNEQRDRSLTVMIPRAKYRPVAPMSPVLTMSTFGAPEKRAIAHEQKLISYLESGGKSIVNKDPRGRASTPPKKPSTTSVQKTEPPVSRKSSAPIPRKQSTVSGALVSAGFEVSATVGRKDSVGPSGAQVSHNTLDNDGSHLTTLRTNISPAESDKITTRNQQDSALREKELTMSEARSCGETTIQAPTKTLRSLYSSKPGSHNLANDEGHTMAERDLGSTLLMPQTHLYKPDRGSDISNFDSL